MPRFFLYGAAYPHFVSRLKTPQTSINLDIIRSEAKNKIERDLLETVKFSAAFWWPCNAFNFAFVSSRYRAIWTSAASVVWSCYLSLVQHRPSDELGSTNDNLIRRLTKKIL
mmetsp:Transcript_17586/g.35032  ORF Transcript_17586/g.35032 Transcript_17586/m.35032 type:complete len:112 (-) Transcript_17586:10-345(-)